MGAVEEDRGRNKMYEMIEVEDVGVSAEIEWRHHFLHSMILANILLVGIIYISIRDPTESTANSSPYFEWEQMTQRESWIKISKKEVKVEVELCVR